MAQRLERVYEAAERDGQDGAATQTVMGQAKSDLALEEGLTERDTRARR